MGLFCPRPQRDSSLTTPFEEPRLSSMDMISGLSSGKGKFQDFVKFSYSRYMLDRLQSQILNLYVVVPGILELNFTTSENGMQKRQ